MATLKTFIYTAIDAQGKNKKGEVESSSVERAYQIVKSQGLAPVTVKDKSSDLMQKEISIPGLEKRAKTKSLAIFSKQFALLIKSGIPILEALKVIAEQTEDKVLKKALEAVSEDVENGLPLSTAMEKHPHSFPTLLTAIVAVGEEGGFLDQSFASMAKTFKDEVELKQKIRSAMMYPVIVSVLTVLVLAGMLIFVVPIFGQMFEDIGSTLPLPTQILISLSNNMIIIGPVFLVLCFILFVLYRNFKDEIWLRSRVDMLKLKVPVFGSFMRKISITRFATNLSMMLSAGTPLVTALKLVGSTTNNWVFQQAINQAIIDVENGNSFSNSIKDFSMFPPMVKNMIVVGEDSGSLSVMLDTVSDFYAEEVKEASESLSETIEPLLIVFMGIVVGGMLVALYMPMLSLFSQMSSAS